ncbi:DNA polymerase III subunit delta' [Erwinia psidii]|uniref:DNA polymerase III subunit delta' n=1 Tax=Erwinia psidii TaxID=69224 RepID=A0A3N6RX05_9GAMM|nr:DNA polymerase III subunit delta' [Erwinia psidii]MCX8955779.1 DNA polymerase III subunit delta' [Erwinia psidii]MCX8961664.1 DNA polymerase III subunit delta' [Erwinia psidii]RQM37618.1 DNA polymerase III subunit delta' [Erwinia psidii]
MNWYPWLNQPYREIITQHQAGRAHHALLLHGLHGLGETSLVWGIGRWLMCQQRDGLKSCGKCHACQLMQANTHPDWYQLNVEKGKSSLGIDAIRAVTEKLYHHAQQGGAKIVSLPDASWLTEAAANALLKTLEEPPKNCWFLFFCEQPSRLPATLRSRCFRYPLAVPDERQSLGWLQKQISVSEPDAITALRLSGGAPVAAQSLLEEASWSARQAFCRVLPSALRGDILALNSVLNHDDVLQRTGWLCALLVDALKWQQGGGQFISNVDQQALVADIAMLVSASVLDESIRLWMYCRERLSVVAINRELILTDQLLSWEQILHSPLAC